MFAQGQYPLSTYDPAQVGKLRLTRNDATAAEGVQFGLQHGITASGNDNPGERVLLILVDEQIDFCFEAANPHGDVGALAVPGALDDTRRVISWIYQNVGKITDIAFSLDTHIPIQIFSPLYWMNYADPRNPKMADPWSTVTGATYGRDMRPIYDPEIEIGVNKTIPWNPEYIKRLGRERQMLGTNVGKKDLQLWPTHCLWGTPGYALVPDLYEAILFWSAARQQNPTIMGKGFNPFTEHYSILESEVPFPGDALTMLDLNLMSAFATYDKIFVAGQAKSHCVLETLFSLINHFASNASHMLQRMYILDDCMSPVLGVGNVFDNMTRPYYDMFEQKYGVNLVKSTQAAA